MKNKLIYLISYYLWQLHVSLVAMMMMIITIKTLSGLGIIQKRQVIFILNLSIMAMRSVFPKD